jgi:energy-coupling factor transporter transmembrane protein EcfT
MIARTWLRSISVDLLWTHPIIIIILFVIIIVVVGIIVVVVIIFIISLIACLEKKTPTFVYLQPKKGLGLMSQRLV